MIYNRPTVIAVIVAFTALTNLLVVVQTLTYGLELITPLVILFNLVIPCLTIVASIGVWNIKQWGWLLLVLITGINFIAVIAVIAVMFTLPISSYIPYLMQRGIGLLIGATIFYYLFHKHSFALFSIPLEKRSLYFKKILSFCLLGGLIQCLILWGFK